MSVKVDLDRLRRDLGASRRSAGARVSSTPTWAWHWVGGGYNTCQAETFQEAARKAVAMGRRSGLEVQAGSMRQANARELAALDRMYQ